MNDFKLITSLRSLRSDENRPLRALREIFTKII